LKEALALAGNLLFVVLLIFLAYKARRRLSSLFDSLGISKFGVSPSGEISIERFENQMVAAYEKRLNKPPSENDRRRIRNIRQYLAPVVLGRRVLWVDDDHAGNKDEHFAFAEMSVEIQDCRTTDEAIHMLENDARGFDLVISDWTREEERVTEASAGLELLKRIREEKNCLIPVIFYHGSISQDELEKRRKLSRERGGGSTTGSPGQLLELTVGELVRAALKDEGTPFYTTLA
jgi:hypothetical protein